MTSFAHNPALQHCWFPVAESVDVDIAADENRAVAVRLLANNYAIWRGADGALVAAPDRCPHREAPLSVGRVK